MGFWDSYNSAYGAARQGALAQQQARSNATISGALARGDFDGAAQEAAKAGNYGLMASLQQQKMAKAKQDALGALNASFGAPASAPAQGALAPPAPRPAIAAPASISDGPAVTGAVAPPPSLTDAPPDTVTVTGRTPQPNLYDLTQLPKHPHSAETLTAAQKALAAGVSPAEVTQMLSFGQQLASTGDEGKIAQIDAVTKIAAQALNIEDPKQRKAWAIDQIAASIPDKVAAAQYVQAASAAPDSFWDDNGLSNFVHQHQTAAEVIKAAREDAKSAQEQANKEADQAITKRGQDLTHEAAMANVGVAKGRLGVAQAAHEARLRAGGYGTPGIGTVGASGAGTDEEPPN